MASRSRIKHDTIIECSARPGWRQRMMQPLDSPEVLDRMEAIAWLALKQFDAVQIVTVSARFKGRSVVKTLSRGHLI